ncbi:MAG: ABC transporter ATP-binding protein [Chloroflexi bacterium]|nr:ABC transporter ATP-binding protein [Chloroflexota bacterium]
MSICLKNVSIHYGVVEAVADVCLEEEHRQIISLLGGNGCGKTSVMKAISGLIRPSSGEIWFDGKRIDRLSTGEIIRLGIVQVPQGRQLFPDMTVHENLIMGAYTRKSKKEIQADMEMVIAHFPVLMKKRKQKAGTLSGGQQEALAFGRALMAKPRLLLMDEPSQGLAPAVVQEVNQIIKEVNQKGIGVILVEHNLRLALDLADKVYVLEAGRKIFQGTPKDLSQDDYVRKIYLGT